MFQMLRRNRPLFAVVLLMIAAMFAGGGCGGSGGSSDGSSGPEEPDLPGTLAEFADLEGSWDLSKLDAKANVTVNDGVVDTLLVGGDVIDVIKVMKGEYTALFERAGDGPGNLTMRIPDGLWNTVKGEEDYGDYTGIYGGTNPANASGSASLSIVLGAGTDERVVTVTLDDLSDGEGEEPPVADFLPFDTLDIPLKRTAPGRFEIDVKGNAEDFAPEEEGVIADLTYWIKADLTIEKDSGALNILVNGKLIIYYKGAEIGGAVLNNIVLRAAEKPPSYK
ncbi:MAG: hypothetical protein LBS75_02655 [Synergistaceae bacterium]|jgi:hypothetical protein|nr:hypothetical protein [Synergistaceae bacterium]